MIKYYRNFYITQYCTIISMTWYKPYFAIFLFFGLNFLVTKWCLKHEFSVTVENKTKNTKP